MLHSNRQLPIPSMYRSLLRKKRRLDSRLSCIKSINPSSTHIVKIEQKIKKLLEDMKNVTFNAQYLKEKRAIEKIKSKPKYFYSFAKKHSKTKFKISQLIVKKDEVLTERKDIANALQHQFCDSFSDPNNNEKQIPLAQTPPIVLNDFNFSVEDIIKAIDEINVNSSGPDFSIPAPVLKNCKNVLSKPLLLLWDHSFKHGIVPTFYKHQLITPVFKKGSRSLPANYRPVSLTAHEIKIFERILRAKMVDFLEENNLLCHQQHGFRKGRSCLTELLEQYDEILNNFLNQNETDVIYLDFAKAFDKVDHQILLQKIKNIGIGGKLFDWIRSFLSNRNQVVVVDGVLSFLALVISGVPQGTVLGPLLFLIYLNDIADCLKYCKIKCFADDSRIFRSISLCQDNALLQHDLLKVSEWSKLNNMKLHDDKFVYLNFNIRSKKSALVNLPFYTENLQYKTSTGQILEPSDTVTDLGVLFSENLDWSSHVSMIVKKAKQKAGWALSVFRDRSPLVMNTLFKSLIRSLLEYACPLWIGLSLQNMRDLEAVQRAFTNKTTCPPYVSNYWDRLQYLNIMSLQRRRERYVILHMWKILNGKTTNDLNICFYESSRYGLLARIPPLSVSCSLKAKSLYDLSFAVVGPKLWNLVPKSIKLIDTLNAFKSRLDDFLKKIPDHPPVAGYIVQNNNSLAEWFNTGTFGHLYRH